MFGTENRAGPPARTRRSRCASCASSSIASGRLTSTAATTFAPARMVTASSVLSGAAASSRSACCGRTRSAWLCAIVGNRTNSGRGHRRTASHGCRLCAAAPSGGRRAGAWTAALHSLSAAESLRLSLTARPAARGPPGDAVGEWSSAADGAAPAAPSSRVVVAVTSATAASKASTLAPVGRVRPLTLRTYWRAAASISSWVAAGSSPRSSVMLRHMRPTIGAMSAADTVSA